MKTVLNTVAVVDLTQAVWFVYEQLFSNCEALLTVGVQIYSFFRLFNEVVSIGGNRLACVRVNVVQFYTGCMHTTRGLRKTSKTWKRSGMCLRIKPDVTGKWFESRFRNGYPD